MGVWVLENILDVFLIVVFSFSFSCCKSVLSSVVYLVDILNSVLGACVVVLM